MKAAVITRYGPPDVVTIRDVPRPEPGPGEILVRVHATTVNRTDCGRLRPYPGQQFKLLAAILMRLAFGLLRPRCTIFGMDFAGEVEGVGAGVRSFAPGDRVFGLCSIRRDGAHAEYVCVPEQGAIAGMPAGVRFEEVVVCEGAYYAITGLKRFHVGPGHRILIYGASGAIGTAALQLARFQGADVTAVVATRHLALAKSLGADRVIDFTKEDFTRIGERFDFIFDAVGKADYFRCRRLLKSTGVFMSTDAGPGWQNLPLMLWSMITRSNRVVVPIPERGSAPAFMEFMKNQIASGQFRAVIDRRYPLDAIADAYRYVETAQKTGIVVIDVIPPEEASPTGDSAYTSLSR